MQENKIKYKTMKCKTIKCKTIKCKTIQCRTNSCKAIWKMENDPEKSGHLLQRYGKIYFNIFWYTSPKTGWLGLVTSYIRNKNCIVKDLHQTTCGLCLELFWKWSWKIRIFLKPSGKWDMIWKNPAGFETVRKVGNYLEESRQFIRFFWFTLKNFRTNQKDSG